MAGSQAQGGASEESLPLLGDLESNAVWNESPSLDEVEAQVSEACDMSSLLSEHHAEVLRYVQTKGVSRLGELEEEDGIVFAAFEQNGLLAFGSDHRRLDWEGEWRRRLRAATGRRRKPGGWSNRVTVEAFVVTIRDAAAPERRGLLQPLLKRYQDHRCSSAVFALPAAQAVIEFKWNTFARGLLMFELCWFLLWLVSFNVFVIAFQDEDLSLTLKELLGSTRGRVTVAAEILALVGMAPFLLLEAGTIPAYGFAAWMDVWNALDASTYFIQIAVTVMHMGRWYTKSEWLTTLLAVQCILLVFRLQWFTQAFTSVRFAFLPIIKDVWRDLRFFFAFMLLVMWGFACAFYIALRQDQEQEEFRNIGTSLLAMFEHQFGDIEMKPMWKSKSPKVATGLAVLYTFVQGTIIINALLGIVISSLDKIMGEMDFKMMLNRVRVIDEIESTMPKWLQRRHPDWFPHYVHFLRINPDKLDRVEQDALWSQMGRDEPEILQSQHSSELKKGHPRHVSGDCQEGSGDEGGNGGNGGGKGKGKEKEEEGGGKSGEAAGGGAGASKWPSGPPVQEEGGAMLAGQVAAMQRQLEEQGRLLRSIAAQLSVTLPGANGAPVGAGAVDGGGRRLPVPQGASRGSTPDLDEL